MTAFKPFDNDTQEMSIGEGFSLTNGREAVLLSGELELAMDQTGLRRALALRTAVDAIVRRLQDNPALPAPVHRKPEVPPGQTDNPFL
jgi:hypothetical protein